MSDTLMRRALIALNMSVPEAAKALGVRPRDIRALEGAKTKDLGEVELTPVLIGLQTLVAAQIGRLKYVQRELELKALRESVEAAQRRNRVWGK